MEVAMVPRKLGRDIEHQIRTLIGAFFLTILLHEVDTSKPCEETLDELHIVVMIFKVLVFHGVDPQSLGVVMVSLR